MDIYAQITILFLIMLIGGYARKKDILNETLERGLSNFLLNITLPLLVINSFDFNFSKDMFNNIILALIYSIIAFIIAIILSNIIFNRVEVGRREVLKFCGVFCNCGFMGFPIIESIYGKEGLVYASIFNMIFTILIWTYGVRLYGGKSSISNLRSLLKNPGILSVIIGLFIMATPINLPSVIKSVLEIVGGMTTPLSMIITGSMMAGISLKAQFKNKSMYLGIATRLLIIPLVLYIITLAINLKSVPASSIVIIEAMPVGATASIFSQTFNKEKELSAFSVFMSTLISMITIPIIVGIVV